ncbi:MAG TPA: iron-containing alcohol dehydrogenase [Dehalococcoidia bacterium]|jgi:hydroxyacid-oxoacid transhydrogenase|nr:iron-containing alcohol dehydrogenase [Dehalococcoidia bacterium]HIM59366.1 iron-containing alcohol dehydrogenase [Dehalococcoidia bacterium]|tara:strand:+ start:3083 stop:4378 length:1296 start_codon:yes stop_codon:yes gene_type:complete
MTSQSAACTETAFTIDTSSIKFGPGITREAGYELDRLGASRVMVVTDPQMAGSAAVNTATNSLKQANVDFAVFDRVSVEPTDVSFKEAIEFAVNGRFDGFLPVGGGSSIDTAKAANLYSTYPADFLEYVNAPIGEGTPVPGDLKPLVAVPTTAGTGSETTGVAIFDFEELGAKTGIAHRSLRPDVGLVDPENTRSLPKMVAACSGFDVLCHGIESYTALSFSQREAPVSPAQRPTYQGANPISDVWALAALEMVGNSILPAVLDPDDLVARSNMAMAATFAGVGFGNAGVHLPHGMSYAVSGLVTDYAPEDYPQGKAIVPHGMAVILNAPAVFRYTASSNPERHMRAARLLGADIAGAGPEDAGDLIADRLIFILKEIGVPNGLGGVGYTPDDIPALVEGTLPQHRVTKLAPRATGADELTALFTDSMQLW